MQNPNRRWLIHLLTATAVVVSLGLPFVSVSLTGVTSSGRFEFEDSASFLGRGTGRAGGDQAPLPGTTLPADEAISLAESITEPLNLSILVHVAAILALLALIRTPTGAVLGLVGGAGGLALTVVLGFLMRQRAEVVEGIAGPSLNVDFGLGSVLVPVAFGLAGLWGGARLMRRWSASEEVTARQIDDASTAAGGGRTPAVIGGVGWYLVILAALGVLVLFSPTARSGSQLAWRVPWLALTALAGTGLIVGKHWAYVLALALGGVSAVSAIPFLLFTVSDAARAGIFLLPGLLMTALLLAPFALLLREDSRLWFRGVGRPSPG